MSVIVSQQNGAERRKHHRPASTAAGLVSDVFPSDLTLEYALQRRRKWHVTRRWPYKRQSKRCPVAGSGFASRTCPGATVIHLLAATEDRHEGISAFLQKRTPTLKDANDGIHPQSCRKGRDTLTLNRPERLNSFNDEMHAHSQRA